VRLDPHDGRALSNWALALMHDGDRLAQEAERVAERGGPAAATAADSLRVRARERYREALARADRAVQVAPDFANAYYNRAVLYRYKLPDPSRAAADFEQVLRLVPDHPRAAAMRREIARLRGR
jgi:tetratricopeptide (TPR) repeat protein